MNKSFSIRISVVAELGKIAFWKSINRVSKTFKRLSNLVSSTISLCKVEKMAQKSLTIVELIPHFWNSWRNDPNLKNHQTFSDNCFSLLNILLMIHGIGITHYPLGQVRLQNAIHIWKTVSGPWATTIVLIKILVSTW